MIAMPVAESSRLYAPTQSSLAKAARPVSPPLQRRLSPSSTDRNGSQGSEPRVGLVRASSPTRTAALAGNGFARENGAVSREEQPASVRVGQRADGSADPRRWSAGGGAARIPSASSPPSSPRYTRRTSPPTSPRFTRRTSPPSSPGLGPSRPSRRTDNTRDGGNVALGRQGLQVLQGRRLSETSSSMSVLGVVQEQTGDGDVGSRQGSIDAFETMSNSSQISDSGSYCGSAPASATKAPMPSRNLSPHAVNVSPLSPVGRNYREEALVSRHAADVGRYYESGQQLGQALRGGGGHARIVSRAERAMAAELATLADSVTDADVYAPSPAAASLMSAMDGLSSAASAFASASAPTPVGAPSSALPYNLPAYQPVSPWPPTVVALARPAEGGLGGLDTRARLGSVGRTLAYGSSGSGGEVGRSFGMVDANMEGQRRVPPQQPTKDSKALARSLLQQLSGGGKGPLAGGPAEVIAVRRRSGGESGQRDETASGVSASVPRERSSGSQQAAEVTSAIRGDDIRRDANRGAETSGGADTRGANAREAQQEGADSLFSQGRVDDEEWRAAGGRKGADTMPTASASASSDGDASMAAAEAGPSEEKPKWKQPWSQTQRRQLQEVEQEQMEHQERKEQMQQERMERKQQERMAQKQQMEPREQQQDLYQQPERLREEEARQAEAIALTLEGEEEEEREKQQQRLGTKAEEQRAMQRQQKLPSQPTLLQQQQQQQQQAVGGGSPVSTLDVAMSKGSPSTDAGEEDEGECHHPTRMHAHTDADVEADWMTAHESEKSGGEVAAEAEAQSESAAEGSAEAVPVMPVMPVMPTPQLLQTQGDKQSDPSPPAATNAPPTTDPTYPSAPPPFSATPTLAQAAPNPPVSLFPPAALPPPPPLESLSTVDLTTVAFLPPTAHMEEDIEYIRYVLVAAGFAALSLPPAASPSAPISPGVFEVLEAEFLSLDGIIVDPANPPGPTLSSAAAGADAGSRRAPGAAAGTAAATAASDTFSESESLPSDAAPAFSSPALPLNYPDERRQRRLLFDAVNEALGRRLSPFLLPSQPWEKLQGSRPASLKKRPAGRRLLQEVWAEIHSWAVPMCDDVFDTLDDLARRDLWKGVDTWVPMDKAAEGELPGVVFSLEGLIMGDLIGDICVEWGEVERRKGRGRDGQDGVMDGPRNHGENDFELFEGAHGGKAGINASPEKDVGLARGSPTGRGKDGGGHGRSLRWLRLGM